MPITVAERSKTRVCAQSLAGIAGSNPARGMDLCVVCCTYRQKAKRRIIKTKEPSTDEVQSTREYKKTFAVQEKFSAPVQIGPGSHPASYTMGTGSFPGVARAWS